MRRARVDIGDQGGVTWLRVVGMAVVRSGTQGVFGKWEPVLAAECAMEVVGKDRRLGHFWGFWLNHWETGGATFWNGDMGEGADLEGRCCAQLRVH